MSRRTGKTALHPRVLHLEALEARELLAAALHAGPDRPPREEGTAGATAGQTRSEGGEAYATAPSPGPQARAGWSRDQAERIMAGYDAVLALTRPPKPQSASRTAAGAHPGGAAVALGRPAEPPLPAPRTGGLVA